MFFKTRIKELTEEIETLNEKLNHANAVIHNANVHNDNLIANFKKSCRLIAFRREGNKNIFTYAKDDKQFDIVTYSTMSDDWSKWCTDAGLNNGGAL